MIYLDKIFQVFKTHTFQGSPAFIEDLQSLMLNERQLEYLHIAVNKAAVLENYFGDDFASFFNRPDIYKVIRGELLDVLGDKEPKTFLDHDHWEKKHPFNFPGPFYTGETDTCDTGPLMAPLI